MRPDESLRVKCVELAIAAGCPDRPGSGLIAFASTIEQYLTGKTAIELAKLAQPALLTDAQQAAVRQIVAEMLATMLEGTDERIRAAVSAIAIDAEGRLCGISPPDRQIREAMPPVTGATEETPLGDRA